MYQVEDEPMETIHLYVVREGQKRPSIVPVILSILALSLLIAIGIGTPYQQPEQRASIRVPAVLLPLKTFTTSIEVIPTGIKQYPAMTAHGTLTITNGSILSEALPKGMIFTGKDGVEVTTDAAVFVPAGGASGYGVASVSAHTTVSGKNGNIPALDIDSVEGSSIYIRNLHAFNGGQDAYAVTFVTQQDRLRAVDQARNILLTHTLSGLLFTPCKENIAGEKTLYVIWACQFVTYHPPQGKVLHAEVAGHVVILEIVYVERPRILTAK